MDQAAAAGTVGGAKLGRGDSITRRADQTLADMCGLCSIPVLYKRQGIVCRRQPIGHSMLQSL